MRRSRVTAWRGVHNKGLASCPKKQKGPSESNYLRESIVAIIAALIAKADNIVTDVMLVAVIGYLLAMDYRSRHGRR